MKYLFAFFAVLVLSLSAFSQQKGQPAPQVFATTFEGKTINTSDLKGKVVVLNLWFINCPNCVEEIQKLNGVVDEFAGNPNIIFLAPAINSQKELVPFLKKNPFKYQVIPSAQNIILGKFGTVDKDGQVSTPFPMHYVVDGNGTITLKMQGIKGVEAVRAELRRMFPKR